MAYDRSLTLVFLPTAYGTVEPPLAGGHPRASDDAATLRGGLSDAEIAAEQADTDAFRIARLEHELAEMRAEFKAMKEEFGVQSSPADSAGTRAERERRQEPLGPATPASATG